MKNISIMFILCTFTLISCAPKELPTQVEINDKIVSVKLSHQSTKNEMDSIALKAAEFGVTMDYSKSTFFDDGKLRILIMYVKSPFHSGQTNSDLIGLQTRYVGFEYDAVTNGFKIGTMDNSEIKN